VLAHVGTVQVVRDETVEIQAVVADELELVRLGLAAILGPLGVGVCGECHSGREAAELAAFVLPDLVIVGAVADGSTLDALRRVRAVQPTPRTIGLFGRAGDPDAATAGGLGVDGMALRTGSLDDLADVVLRVLKDEKVVVPGLHTGLVGDLAVAADAATGSDLLSAREREMLGFLAQGRSNREIATTLSLSLATVKTHLVRLYAKLEARNRNEALARAVALGLLR
jgi:DNA-binding NarL/FixJ family response regulator